MILLCGGCGRRFRDPKNPEDKEGVFQFDGVENTSLNDGLSESERESRCQHWFCDGCNFTILRLLILHSARPEVEANESSLTAAVHESIYKKLFPVQPMHFGCPVPDCVSRRCTATSDAVDDYWKSRLECVLEEGEQQEEENEEEDEGDEGDTDALYMYQKWKAIKTLGRQLVRCS